MARVPENQLVLPALYLLSSTVDGLKTSNLKASLMLLLPPKGEDAEILAGRGDTKLSQKIRNLKSHDTLERDGYATYSRTAGSRDGLFTITDKGKRYLSDNFDWVQYLLTNNFSTEDIEANLIDIPKQKNKNINVGVFDENYLIHEGNVKYMQSKVYERSSQLRNFAVANYTINGRIKCSACCFDFEDFYGEYGKGFIEIHHQKPVFMLDEREFTKTLEVALDNVIPVCSNCHRMVHKARKPLMMEELKTKINQKLGFCI